MSFNGNRSNFGFNGFGGNRGNSLLEHMCRFIGETVTIFTTSGGASGCGFTGVVLSVNPCFVRLVTEQGFPPSNPLAENICGEMDNGPGRGQGGSYCKGSDYMPHHSVGSVCDIPVDRIAAFCHNAV
ncbi:MAG: putative rane protein [Herbinix sp.]|nr:putative rane protein [Herbinix sp.]